MTTDGGFRSSTNASMLLTTLFVVLLALLTPMPSAARFAVWRPSEHIRGRRDVEEGLTMDLMQYHHIDSPYATPNLTLTQRIEIAVKSSQERARYFHSQIYGTESPMFGSDLAFSSPVFSAQGSYIMKFSLGSPSRDFVAIADTGSDLVWVQCAPCGQCFSQPDAVYNPAASSSHKARSCTGDALCSALPPRSQPCSSAQTCLYQYAYGDQSSTQGDLASEMLTLTSTSGSTQTFSGFGFGCGHDNQGTFQLSDGLVGLGQGPLSLVRQLGSQINDVFAYCLVDFFSASSKTSTLLLGSTGSNSLSYTPLITNSANPSFYYVTVTGITISGTPLSYPASAFAITASGGGGMILDSGTTLTQMDNRAYSPFVRQLASLINYQLVDGSSAGFDLCYSLAGVSSPSFPAVVFKFANGLDVALPANNLFLQVDNNPNYCLAFQGSNLGLSIFGNIQQQNFQIAYDRGSKQVGFAPNSC